MSSRPSADPQAVDRELARSLSRVSALPESLLQTLLLKQPTLPPPRGAEILLRQQRVPRPLAEVFPFFAQAENLQHLTPSFLDFRILTPLPIPMAVGTLIDYRIRLRGLPMRWRTRIGAWQPPHRFADQQLSGPYRVWWHEHLFAEHDGGTLITDRVVYKAPFSFITHPFLVRRELARIFDYRTQVISDRFGTAAPPVAR